MCSFLELKRLSSLQLLKSKPLGLLSLTFKEYSAEHWMLV